jgi:1-phosphofructokinase
MKTKTRIQNPRRGIPLRPDHRPEGDRADRTDISVCVFGPCLYLTITIEEQAESPHSHIHIHPGGQAFWIARMLKHLGQRPILVSPLGGETGLVIEKLAPSWGVDLMRVDTQAASPAYIHDRRSGERDEIASSKPPPLDRHELDDLYNAVLENSALTGTAVMTGKQTGHDFPVEAFKRLGADLHSTGTTVIGDLHGEELMAYLEGGPLHLLKVSDEDIIKDGLLKAGANESERIAAAKLLTEKGAANVVISSCDGPTMAHLQGEVWSATPRHLEPVDPRGSGDSMTAALVVGHLEGYPPDEMLQLACAAGAANVTRHGLGNVKPGLVDALAKHVEVHRL